MPSRIPISVATRYCARLADFSGCIFTEMAGFVEKPLALSAVAREHGEQLTELYDTRSALLGSSHLSLSELRRLDDRIEAHLDGAAVAAEQGAGASNLISGDFPSASLFTGLVYALRRTNLSSIRTLLTGSQQVFNGFPVVLSAFGWVAPRHLQGIVARFVVAEDPFERLIGVAVCAMHRSDPGLATGPWMRDHNAEVRARAIRAGGEIGVRELVPDNIAALGNEDPKCGFWAAWSAVLLGNREAGLAVLKDAALTPTAHHRARAFRLALQTMSVTAGHALLLTLSNEPSELRWLMQGSGIVGDSSYVPWLIGHMSHPGVARLAGEAFTLITGADLDALQLWKRKLDEFESGPNDHPEDENVEMDPDEGLPWPDPGRVQAWWDANKHRFQPGQRYFMGAPVTREHCIEVLKNGYQRQRILAAHYLCLLNPGTPLFNTSAPAWRQQKLLAQM